jgi:hypothetical protein
MMTLRKMSFCLAACLALAAVLACEVSGLAQCGMCKTALAGSNNALFIRNFNIGVLVLLIPPVTIFCSIFIALKRYRASDDDAGK